MEVDSNHRSNLQQIYSLSPLATRESAHHNLELISKKADERTRTVNLLITNQLLCQLSHIGLFCFINKLSCLFSLYLSVVGPTGLEPVTPCL